MVLTTLQFMPLLWTLLALSSGGGTDGSWIQVGGRGAGRRYSPASTANLTQICEERDGQCGESGGRCNPTQVVVGLCEERSYCCVSKALLCNSLFSGFCVDDHDSCLSDSNYTLSWMSCDSTRPCCCPKTTLHNHGGRGRNANRRRGRGRQTRP